MGAGRRVVPQGQADENEQSVEGQTIDEQIELFMFTEQSFPFPATNERRPSY